MKTLSRTGDSPPCDTAFFVQIPFQPPACPSLSQGSVKVR